MSNDSSLEIEVLLILLCICKKVVEGRGRGFELKTESAVVLD